MELSCSRATGIKTGAKYKPPHSGIEMGKAEQTIREILNIAHIELNGNRPFDLQVQDERMYQRILGGGTLAFGESYMDGWWDCDQLDVLVYKLLRANLEHHIKPLKLVVPLLYAKLANRQKQSKAFNIGEYHYDLGNELYTRMLDQRMVYSCAYWKCATNLDDAQEAKLDLVCKKINLEPGMKVLDIGCGWGGFAKFAAERYQVEVVGITVSKEQIELGREMCKGLNVDLRFEDYRDVNATFDRIVSLGMFEHVGAKNYRTYMNSVHRCLSEDGLFLLHTIGVNTVKVVVDAWTDKYIFPGGMLPTQKRLSSATEGLFVMEDWHNFGPNYDPTLIAWMQNVDAHWSELEKLGYDQRFYRMWKFFLLSSAGSFRARRNQLWQIVNSKNGLQRGYRSIR